MTTMMAVIGNIYLDISTRLPMAELRRQAELIGLTEVTSWSSMGNLVFESGNKSPQEIEDDLELAVRARCGFEINAFVRTRNELAAIVAADQFRDATEVPSHQRVFFLSRVPEPAIVEQLLAHDWDGSSYRIVERELFLSLSSGIGRIMGLFDRLERSAGLVMVERNWNTVLKLHKLCQER